MDGRHQHTSPIAAPVIPQSGRLFVLAAVCLAALVLPLSFTGPAMATPAIARALGGSPSALNWITNAFMLGFGSCLMAAGTLADTYGRKRVFGAGMAMFTLLSLLLAMSPNLLILDLLRGTQGVAAACALAGGTAVLAQEFEGAERSRALSLLGTTFGVGLAFGPLLAGVLVAQLSWRASFVSSALIGAVALRFGWPLMRESRDPQASGLDWPGTLSFTGALTLFTCAVLQGPALGWAHPATLAGFAASLALLAAFVCIEQRSRRPMLDLSLLRYPRFVGVQLLPIGTCYCYVVLLVLLPARLIGIDGRSEVEAGLVMLSLSAPMLLVPYLAALLSRRIAASLLCGVGLLMAACGLCWLAELPLQASRGALAGPLLLIGTGTGLPWGLMDALSLSVVPTERAGMATGIFSTTRVAGEGVALAIVSALLTGLIANQMQDAQAARLLASGQLEAAMRQLPQLSRAMLEGRYAVSFVTLLHALAGVTVVAALAAFLCLGRETTPAAAGHGDA